MTASKTKGIGDIVINERWSLDYDRVSGWTTVEAIETTKDNAKNDIRYERLYPGRLDVALKRILERPGTANSADELLAYWETTMADIRNLVEESDWPLAGS